LSHLDCKRVGAMSLARPFGAGCSVEHVPDMTRQICIQGFSHTNLEERKETITIQERTLDLYSESS
jgi:hypothetical protein